MRALLLRAEGGVRLADVAPAPDPAAAEVRVAMRLTPINPADHLALEARHLTDAYGYEAPMGAEGVGVIEVVGENVVGLAPGDRVLPLDRGNWAERRTISAERLIRAPEGLSDEQAAMFRINPPTAFRLLERSGLRAGDWLVHNGAGSVVGRLITAMAHARGINVICAVRTPEKDRERLLALGATAVVQDGNGLVAAALDTMGGPKAALALDCVTGAATGRLAQCLKPGGRVTVFGHLSHDPCQIASTLLTGNGITIDGYSLRSGEAGAGRAELEPLYTPLADFWANQPLIVPDVRRVSLREVAAAVAYRGPVRQVIDWSA